MEEILSVINWNIAWFIIFDAKSQETKINDAKMRLVKGKIQLLVP